MLEKHLELLGELTAEKHLEERAVTEASIQAAIGVVVQDIELTKQAIDLSLTALESRPTIDPDQLVSIDALDDYTKASDDLRSAAIKEAGDELKSELLQEMAEVRDGLSEASLDIVNGLSELKESTQADHAVQLKELTDQLKSQQTFEAMLTTRLAEIKDGAPGDKGEPGEAGVDRPLLEPVALKEGKNYPKNTLGTHQGGLWISTKETLGSPDEDPMSWSCILDAMATMSVELQDDKTYKMSVRMATGKHIESEFSIPFPVHKGIWEHGHYEQGEIVTKGHSMWMAMEDTNGEPPGNAWQQIMTAPRGKQGPAGKSITGEQGKPGRNGRDGKDAEIDWDIQRQFVEGIVYTDKRSASYPLRAFRGYYTENESYLVGDVVRIGYSLSVVTQPIPKLTAQRDAVAATESMISSGTAVSTASKEKPMIWRGDYQNKAYNEGDVVFDAGFTMVSLADNNTDRAARIPYGPEIDIFNGTLTPFDSTGKQVTFGARFQGVLSARYLKKYKVDTVSGYHYQIFSVRDPLVSPIYNQLLSFTASATGTAEFGLPNTIVKVGDSFDLVVIATIPDPAPDTWSGNWDYDTPGNPKEPGNGDWQQPDGTLDIMRVAKIDEDLVDQSANLAAVEVGDIIDSGIRWTVQSIDDMGSWVQFGVSPATQAAPDGVRAFVFENIPDSQIAASRDIDYWTNNNPDIQGLFGVDTDYSDIIPDGNAYGVNITYQEAYISDNWDIVAYSDSLAPSDPIYEGASNSGGKK